MMSNCRTHWLTCWSNLWIRIHITVRLFNILQNLHKCWKNPGMLGLSCNITRSDPAKRKNGEWAKDLENAIFTFMFIPVSCLCFSAKYVHRLYCIASVCYEGYLWVLKSLGFKEIFIHARVKELSFFLRCSLKSA